MFFRATICVLSVKTLNVTGSTYSPSSFLAKLSLVSSLLFSGAPVTGFVPCCFSHGRMLVRSNVVPSAVQTGCSKGWRETAQKLKGRRLKEAPGRSVLRAFAPAEAPKASSLLHSECVICAESQWRLEVGMQVASQRTYSLSVPVPVVSMRLRHLRIALTFAHRGKRARAATRATLAQTRRSAVPARKRGRSARTTSPSKESIRHAERRMLGPLSGLPNRDARTVSDDATFAAPQHTRQGAGMLAECS